MCPKEIKFRVMLADFDFITESKEAIDRSALPNVRCQVKTDEDMKRELGTMVFRAPEVSHKTDNFIQIFLIDHHVIVTYKINSAEVCLCKSLSLLVKSRFINSCNLNNF